jgi:uncharacterized OB-fold protein
MAEVRQPVPIARGIMRLPPDVPSPRLIAGRCARCGSLSFPKRQICPDCFDQSEIEEIYLSTEATLASYTVVRRGARSGNGVQALGYVDTPEGLRLFTPLEVVESVELEIGCPLELIFEEQQSEGGSPVTTFKYRPT